MDTMRGSLARFLAFAGRRRINEDIHRERERDRPHLQFLDSFLQDLRYSGRTLRRDAGLAAFAVLIIGLGVGAGSMVFNLTNALLLRPFPFRSPDQLVWIANGRSTNLSAQTVQVVNLQDLEAQSRTLEAVAGFSPFYGPGDIRFMGAGEPQRVTAVPVTAGFFPLLGVQPQAGRLFRPSECTWGAPRTVLLSDRFWRQHFASDPRAVGGSITLDSAPATIVGVLPESFDFAGMFVPGSRADLFVPFPLSPETNRQGNTLALVGRLKRGVTVDRAQAEAAVIGARMKSLPGDRRNSFNPVVTSLRDRVSGTFRPVLFVLAGAVAFVMLIVCVNLSGLLLARGSLREREMAIRVALGAGRCRLIRQVLAESLVLSCAGSVLGVLVATAGTSIVARFNAVSVPLLQHVRVDAGTLAFAALAAIFTGLVVGLAPALRVSATAPYTACRTGDRRVSGGGDRGVTRTALVVTELALACVLLTGAGLLLRSLVRVLDVKLGFRSDHIVTVRVDPVRGKYPTPQARTAARTAYLAEILRQARAVDGVEAVGLTDSLPLGQNFGWRFWSVGVTGQVYERGRRPLAHPRIVDEGYLSVMRIPLLAGRWFTPADIASAQPVIVVNETMARAFWPDRQPLGETVDIGHGDLRTVAGVVQDVRYFGAERSAENEFYLPYSDALGSANTIDLVVRDRGASLDLVPALRAALRRADPGLPVTEFQTLTGLVDRSLFTRRFVVWLIGAFAVFALILAGLGIYGVISYSVGRRTQEIGIRIALGASPGVVQAGILAQTLAVCVAGMSVGAAGSWAVARALGGLLFGITFSDPATHAAALALLALAALVAGYLPARRASRVDPLTALRAE